MGCLRLDLGALDALRSAAPMVIAPNHPSMVDAGLVLSRLPDLACIMKGEILDSILFGTGARAAGYIASHRKAWWSVGLRKPAPILATYMARRAPVFTRNLADARHINVAHGLYPREAMSDSMMMSLVDYLSTGISVIDGRTYAGGLTKFEPGEMERLFVPGLEMLAAAAQQE